MKHLTSSSSERRADLVLHDGFMAIVNHTITPREAARVDQAFVRAAIEAAGIELLLIRGDGGTPVIVVDWEQRAALAEALAVACAEEPFLARTEKLSKAAKSDIAARSRGVASGDRPSEGDLFSSENHRETASEALDGGDLTDGTELTDDTERSDTTELAGAAGPTGAATPPQRVVRLADGLFSGAPDGRAFTLYRPRISARGRLVFGPEFGVSLELWEFSRNRDIGEGEGDASALVVADVIAPRPNTLLRHATPREELVREEVLFEGQRWPSLRGMFDAVSEDVRFDIDIVFSWVDGSALEWQRARAKRMESYVVGEGDDHEARFRQLDELKYAMRSVHLFAPWIRNIYIATDSPRPRWLAEHPRVKVVRSEEFFSDLSVLPTHNSHAVESQLHNIEGLSEHFLYSNDDMFFGRMTPPATFFSSGGVSKFIQSNTRIGIGSPNASRSGFENAARVNRALLRDRFGVTITRHLEHAATPLRRSVMRELEAEFPQDFARTAASAFRQASDISVTNSLYHYYALHSGRAVTQTEAKVRYIDTTSRQGIRDMKQLLKRRGHDFFCLNDGSFPELDGEERAHAVRWFLERYFPIPAPWELPE